MLIMQNVPSGVDHLLIKNIRILPNSQQARLRERFHIVRRGRGRPMDGNKLALIARAIENGETYQEIAETWQASYNTMFQFVRNHGLPSPRRKKKPGLQDRLAAIDEAVRDGKNYAAVARDLGVTRERVRQIAAKHGLTPSRRAWAIASPRRKAAQAAERARVQANIDARAALEAEVIARNKRGESFNSMVTSGLLSHGSLNGIIHKHGLKSSHHCGFRGKDSTPRNEVKSDGDIGVLRD